MSVRHPYHPWLYFSLFEDNVFIVDFDQRIVDDNNNFVRYLEPFEIDRICQRVAEKIGLSKLEWGFHNGRCKIWCSKQDLLSFYEIVNKLLKEDLKLYLNDGTYLELLRKDYPISLEKEEKMFLNYLIEEESHSVQTPYTTQLAIHRSNFWTSSEGKDFALHLRKKYLLSDETDKDYPSISEIYGENKKLFV